MQQSNLNNVGKSVKNYDRWSSNLIVIASIIYLINTIIYTKNYSFNALLNLSVFVSSFYSSGLF